MQQGANRTCLLFKLDIFDQNQKKIIQHKIMFAESLFTISDHYKNWTKILPTYIFCKMIFLLPTIFETRIYSDKNYDLTKKINIGTT